MGHKLVLDVIPNDRLIASNGKDLICVTTVGHEMEDRVKLHCVSTIVHANSGQCYGKTNVITFARLEIFLLSEIKDWQSDRRLRGTSIGMAITVNQISGRVRLLHLHNFICRYVDRCFVQNEPTSIGTANKQYAAIDLEKM